MIYLKLFLTFLQIGAVSFGGGYAMIPLVRENCIENAWLTEDAFLNFIAVAESTPGPIAVNMATFVGASQAGLLGSFFATLGLVLPSFVIILIIASLMKNFIKYNAVQSVISGIKPVIIALILITSLTMLLSAILGLKDIKSGISFDVFAMIIFAVVLLAVFVYKKIFKKAISPIYLIIISAILGVIFY